MSRHLLPLASLAAVLSLPLSTYVARAQEPVSAPGPLALYEFDGLVEGRIPDVSGHAPALDLVPRDLRRVQEVPGGLCLTEPTTLATEGPAARLTEACRATGELTVEAWIEPSRQTPRHPARIVTLAGDPQSRNFTLAQGRLAGEAGDVFGIRTRTTATADDGMPLLSSETPNAGPGARHLVYTRRADGRESLWLEGELAARSQRQGSFASWDGEYALALGGEVLGHRPWVGTFHRVALWARALPDKEVRARHAAGADIPKAGWLLVEPEDEIALVVHEGGAAITGDVLVTLTNPGNATIRWGVELDVTGLEIRGAPFGALPPRSRTEIALAPDAEALARMRAGHHFGTLRASNLTNRHGSTERRVHVDARSSGVASLGPAHVGPGDGAALRDVDGFTIRETGAVIEGLRVSGPIVIDADDVVLRDFAIDARGARHGLRVVTGRTGVRIERGTITGARQAAISGGDFSAKGLAIDGGTGQAAILQSDAVLVDSRIDCGTGDSACVALEDATDVILRGCRIEAPPSRPAALYVSDPDRVTVEECWLGGGEHAFVVEQRGDDVERHRLRFAGNVLLPGARGAHVVVRGGAIDEEGNVRATDGMPVRVEPSDAAPRSMP